MEPTEQSATLLVELAASGPGRLELYKRGFMKRFWRVTDLRVDGPGEYRFEELAARTYLLLGGGVGWALEPSEVESLPDCTQSIKPKITAGAPVVVDCQWDVPFSFARGQQRFDFHTDSGGGFLLPGLPAGEWEFFGVPSCPTGVHTIPAGEQVLLRGQLKNSTRKPADRAR